MLIKIAPGNICVQQQRHVSVEKNEEASSFTKVLVLSYKLNKIDHFGQGDKFLWCSFTCRHFKLKLTFGET